MGSNLLDITEQLYTAKISIVVISFFNVITSIFSTYILSLSNLWLFALFSAVGFVFNTLFFYITLKNWSKKENVRVEIKQ